ncbi:uncharacterized protein Tco025E_06955 [Trypanosoma conorhini]|uniref:Uncharacterized protein n=1 Tax=Trypanosoma conorhini TaxID=83891 RepID=A0A3R7NPR8_9TRYP|nr:uncharacterized protein Tco025E_06955 [Trypanosoma conorhini]RNF09624.1 hypothetical protein Tco025E_06955 [Trypanosoma conorhini]
MADGTCATYHSRLHCFPPLCLLARELGVLLLLEQLRKLGLEVLGVLVHFLVELFRVLLNHLLELLVVLLHFRGQGAFVRLVREELLVLLLHLLRKLGIQPVELGGEFLKGGGHGSLGGIIA